MIDAKKERGSNSLTKTEKKKLSANQSITSKKRLNDYGEFFTPENIVDDMLSMVDSQLQRLDSRFLEPACGTGNFLVPVLKRKLSLAKKRYKGIPHEFAQYSILALSSIYGIELLPDNANLCRERLFSLWEKEYRRICKDEYDANINHTAKFILECTIFSSEALSMKTITGEPIVFSEWAFIKPRVFQRTEFLYQATPGDGMTDDSVFLRKYVDDYRRIWNHVD